MYSSYAQNLFLFYNGEHEYLCPFLKKGNLYKIHNLVNKVLEKKVRNSSYFILFFMILGNQNSYIQFKCQKDQFLKGKFKNWMSICTKKKNTEWANHNKEFQDNWNIHIQLIKNTPH